MPLPPPLLSLGFMWGPGIAALVCWRLFRAEVSRPWTFWGGWRFAVRFFAVPLLVLVAVLWVVVGAKALLLLPLAGLFGFLMTLGEELGWRGWLQEALRPLGRWARYPLIGLLWEVWHLRFGRAIFDGAPWSSVLLAEVGWLAATILISAVIGEAFERGRALVVAVTLHLWLNLVVGGEVGQLVGDAMMPVYLVAAGSLLWWAWLLYRRVPRNPEEP
jgi:membrane protease YdiL (CAAX protease family)